MKIAFNLQPATADNPAHARAAATITGVLSELFILFTGLLPIFTLLTPTCSESKSKPFFRFARLATSSHQPDFRTQAAGGQRCAHLLQFFFCHWRQGNGRPFPAAPLLSPEICPRWIRGTSKFRRLRISL